MKNSATGPLHIDTGLPTPDNHQILVRTSAAIDDQLVKPVTPLVDQATRGRACGGCPRKWGDSASAAMSPAPDSGPGAPVFSTAAAALDGAGDSRLPLSLETWELNWQHDSHRGPQTGPSFAPNQTADATWLPPLPLTCSLCAQPFYGTPDRPRSVPRLLPCLHSFCTGCFARPLPGARDTPSHVRDAAYSAFCRPLRRTRALSPAG